MKNLIIVVNKYKMIKVLDYITLYKIQSKLTHKKMINL